MEGASPSNAAVSGSIHLIPGQLGLGGPTQSKLLSADAAREHDEPRGDQRVGDELGVGDRHDVSRAEDAYPQRSAVIGELNPCRSDGTGRDPGRLRQEGADRAAAA